VSGLLSKFLTAYGFTEDPFASTNADKEPKLNTYFVPPPYFASVKGNPAQPKSNIVLAPRGAGKTAQKVMLEDFASQQDNPTFYCVTYDSFRTVSRAKLATVDVEWHLSQVIGRLASGILTLIQDGSRPELSTSDKRILSYVFTKYLGSLSAEDAQRIFSSVKNHKDKTLDFIRNNAKNIAGIVAALPGLWGMPPLELQIIDKEFRNEPSIYIIERLVEIIKKFGFTSVYILVDRVNEVSEFNNDAKACAKFIAPLVTELNLLEMDGIAFKIFLWDQLEGHLAEAGFRSDRVFKHNLTWSSENLEEMLSRRIFAYSGGKVDSLNRMIAEDVDLDLHRVVGILGNGSPRDVIRMVGRIIDEHTRIEDTASPLNWASVEQGVRNYCKERSLELYGVDKVEDLLKIGAVSFTIGDVANYIFRISNQAGRNKIQNMMHVGAVVKSGDIENPGNRPLHQYSIVDPRLACIVMSTYTIRQALTYYCFICPRCEAVLAREGEEASCHLCSLDFPLSDEQSVYCQCRR
jgi:hypothetical protein